MSKNDLKAISGLLHRYKYTNLKKAKVSSATDPWGGLIQP